MNAPALLRVTIEPPLALVELDRKLQKNALSMALRDELEACLAALEGDDGVKAVILTGGPDCFSAGFDLKEVLATDFSAFGHRAVEFTERTYFFAKPLVTAVAGPALAGGFDLALSGDVIVAADGAALGLVDRVVPAGELLAAAREAAARFARNPLPALLAVKRAARAVLFMDARSAIEHEFGLTAELIAEGSVKAALREYARGLGIATPTGEKDGS